MHVRIKRDNSAFCCSSCSAGYNTYNNSAFCYSSYSTGYQTYALICASNHGLWSCCQYITAPGHLAVSIEITPKCACSG